MVESISQTANYEEFEKRNNRALNMLADNVYYSLISFLIVG